MGVISILACYRAYCECSPHTAGILVILAGILVIQQELEKMIFQSKDEVALSEEY